MFSSPTYLCEFTEHVLYSMNQNTFLSRLRYSCEVEREWTTLKIEFRITCKHKLQHFVYLNKSIKTSDVKPRVASLAEFYITKTR